MRTEQFIHQINDDLLGMYVHKDSNDKISFTLLPKKTGDKRPRRTYFREVQKEEVQKFAAKEFLNNTVRVHAEIDDEIYLIIQKLPNSIMIGYDDFFIDQSLSHSKLLERFNQNGHAISISIGLTLGTRFYDKTRQIHQEKISQRAEKIFDDKKITDSSLYQTKGIREKSILLIEKLISANSSISLENSLVGSDVNLEKLKNSFKWSIRINGKERIYFIWTNNDGSGSPKIIQVGGHDPWSSS